MIKTALILAPFFFSSCKEEKKKTEAEKHIENRAKFWSEGSETGTYETKREPLKWGESSEKKDEEKSD